MPQTHTITTTAEMDALVKASDAELNSSSRPLVVIDLGQTYKTLIASMGGQYIAINPLESLPS